MVRVWLIGSLVICKISASRMISCVCGLMRSGNRLMTLGLELVDVAGDGALEMGVDVLIGALNDASELVGESGAFSYWLYSSIVISSPSSSPAIRYALQWSARTLSCGSVIHCTSTQQ